MKSLNKSTILNIIRLNSPISKQKIRRITKLTPPTVTNIVGELITADLVIETELGKSRGGVMKPIMLRFNGSGFNLDWTY